MKAYTLLLVPWLCSGCVEDRVITDGETTGVLDVDVPATCADYCASVGRCMDVDPAACTSACGDVAQQAKRGDCAFELVDAMECLIHDACVHGLPVTALGSSDAHVHPCLGRAAAVSCPLNLLIEDERPFAFFGSGGGLGRCGRGGGNGPDKPLNQCNVQFDCGAGSYHKIDCTNFGSGSRCICRAGDTLVRAPSLADPVCPLNDPPRSLLEACGWRY